MIEFVESFTRYGAAQELPDRWGVVSGTIGAELGGRYPNQRSRDPGSATLTSRDLGTASERTVGHAVFTGGDSAGTYTLSWLDASQDEQFRFEAFDSAGGQSGGQWKLFRGATEVAAGEVGRIPPEAWHLFEVRVLVHPSAGEAEVRLDGVVLYSATGLNTADQGAPGCSFIQLDSGYVARWGDFWITDGEFLGDHFCEDVSPQVYGADDDDGDRTEWDVVADVTHSAALSSPGGGHVESDTANEVEELRARWGVGRGEIAALQVMFLAQLDTAGSLDVRARFKDEAGNVHEGTTKAITSTNDEVKVELWEANPLTGETWDVEALRRYQFGFEMLG